MDKWPDLLCAVLQVLKRLPNLKKLDGIPVDVDERDQALQERGGA
jgi:dynein light chain 1